MVSPLFGLPAPKRVFLQQICFDFIDSLTSFEGRIGSLGLLGKGVETPKEVLVNELLVGHKK